MKNIVITFALSMSFFIVGCDKEKEAKSVSYYVNHPEERRLVLKECLDNPDIYKDDQDCINAKAASQKDSWGDAENFRLK